LKPDRLRKIITSAVKQSLKAYHPVLHDPLSFNDLISKEKVLLLNHYCQSYYQGLYGLMKNWPQDTLILQNHKVLRTTFPNQTDDSMDTGTTVTEIIKQFSSGKVHADYNYFSVICYLVDQRNQKQNPGIKKQWQQEIYKIYDQLHDPAISY
jgi:hypothetical protein